MVSVLDRTSRLWRDFGHHGVPEIGGRDPAALLETITGLEVEDFVALGFALYAHRAAWVPGQPMRLMDDFGCDMEPAKKTAFLEIVARTPEALKRGIAGLATKVGLGSSGTDDDTGPPLSRDSPRGAWAACSSSTSNS